MRPTVLLVALIACGDKGDDTGEAAAPADADGDGYLSAATGGPDCDDDDASVHPGADEVWYDGVDSDCDGASDNDRDGDGYDSVDHGGDDCDDGYDWVNPGASDTWYDGVDSDCDGHSDFDADGDGYEHTPTSYEDCDDSEALIHPGAYDLPGNGVDEDCEGSDRSFDGIVLPVGADASVDLDFDVVREVDVAVLLDTTASTMPRPEDLSFEDLVDQLSDLTGDMHYGFATFDDYNYAGYGIALDLPFTLRQELTDDVSALEAARLATTIHYGGDGPEATMEAIYQALSGVGYDQDCDGGYDASTDVLPYLASAADPFGGTAGEARGSDGGGLGGMGFREHALPIVIYATDNYLRDPDAGYGSPGGCPGDAGAGDVVDAATALGAVIVNATWTDIVLEQARGLAEASGSLVDGDGDGTVSDPAVYSVEYPTLYTDVVEQAVRDVVATRLATYRELSFSAETSSADVTATLAPDAFIDVDLDTTTLVTTTLTLRALVDEPKEALTGELTVTFSVEGEARQTVTVAWEIPPAHL